MRPTERKAVIETIQALANATNAMLALVQPVEPKPAPRKTPTARAFVQQQRANIRQIREMA